VREVIKKNLGDVIASSDIITAGKRHDRQGARARLELPHSRL
jgi:hypothetical protein